MNPAYLVFWLMVGLGVITAYIQLQHNPQLLFMR